MARKLRGEKARQHERQKDYIRQDVVGLQRAIALVSPDALSQVSGLSDAVLETTGYCDGALLALQQDDLDRAISKRDAASVASNRVMGILNAYLNRTRHGHADDSLPLAYPYESSEDPPAYNPPAAPRPPKRSKTSGRSGATRGTATRSSSSSRRDPDYTPVYDPDPSDYCDPPSHHHDSGSGHHHDGSWGHDTGHHHGGSDSHHDSGGHGHDSGSSHDCSDSGDSGDGGD